MKSNKIVIVGSTNMDMVVKTNRIPAPGETILGGEFFMNAGGKGANQAVAVARLGGNSVFISKIGDDIFGKQSFDLFGKEGINTRFILTDYKAPSGIALITVDDKGENSIVVAPGANGTLIPADLEAALTEIDNAAIVLVQLEIPLETVAFLAAYAKSKSVKLILNPAPAATLSTEILQYIDLITPNENEASKISGIDVVDIETAKQAAEIIHKMGVKDIVVTMGSLGALVFSNNKYELVPTPTVIAIDTTAAGDVFNGAMAVALSEGKDLVAAVQFGCKAAAISVTRLGAQASIPLRHELQ